MTDLAIPNKIVTIRPFDPPWLHNEIRKQMRIRKRLYDKAKRSNNDIHWQSYRHKRNEVTNLIWHARTEYFRKLASHLQSKTLSSSDWWKTLKTFIKPNDKTNAIPPLKQNDTIYIQMNMMLTRPKYQIHFSQNRHSSTT